MPKSKKSKSPPIEFIPNDSDNPFDIENAVLPPRPRRQRVVSSDRYISPLSQETQQHYIQELKKKETSKPAAYLKTPVVGKTVFHTFPTPPSTSRKNENIVKEWNRILESPSVRANRFGSLTADDEKYPKRDISHSTELILDAPGARDDYYCSLLDWAPTGNLLVGLGNECFVWSEFQSPKNIFETEDPDFITAISFSPTGERSAIGTEHGIVQIFDIGNDFVPIQDSNYNQSELSALIWKSETQFITGDPVGSLRFWDTRSKSCQLMERYHLDRVVGLAKSPNSLLLASGDNGNLVNVWDQRRLDKPLWVIKEHKSAARALAWCPWLPNLLATGGGLDDGRILFHNTETGKLTRSLATETQVCQILWSDYYREFISAHNSESEQLRIWKYPSLDKVTTLQGHTHRTMNLALSPDGQTVVSLGDDEALKFWKCFPTTKGQKPLRFQDQNLNTSPSIR